MLFQHQQCEELQDQQIFDIALQTKVTYHCQLGYFFILTDYQYKLQVLQDLYRNLKENQSKNYMEGHFVLPGPIIEFILETNSFTFLFNQFLNSDNEEMSHIYALSYQKVITYFIHKLEHRQPEIVAAQLLNNNHDFLNLSQHYQQFVQTNKDDLIMNFYYMGYYNEPNLSEKFNQYIKKDSRFQDPLQLLYILHKSFGKVHSNKYHENNVNRAKQTLYLFVIILVEIFERNQALQDIPGWILNLIFEYKLSADLIQYINTLFTIENSEKQIDETSIQTQEQIKDSILKIFMIQKTRHNAEEIILNVANHNNGIRNIIVSDLQKSEPQTYKLIQQGEPITALNMQKINYVLPQEVNEQAVKIIKDPLTVSLNVIANNPSIFEHITNFYPKTNQEVIQTQYTIPSPSPAPVQKQNVQYTKPHFEKQNTITQFITPKEQQKQIYQTVINQKPIEVQQQQQFIPQAIVPEPFNYNDTYTVQMQLDQQQLLQPKQQKVTLTGKSVQPKQSNVEVLKLNHPDIIKFTHNPTKASIDIEPTQHYYMQQANVTSKGVNYIKPKKVVEITKQFVQPQQQTINYYEKPKFTEKQRTMFIPSPLITDVVSQSGQVEVSLDYMVKLMHKWNIISFENSNLELLKLYQNGQQVEFIIKQIEEAQKSGKVNKYISNLKKMLNNVDINLMQPQQIVFYIVILTFVNMVFVENSNNSNFVMGDFFPHFFFADDTLIIDVIERLEKLILMVQNNDKFKDIKQIQNINSSDITFVIRQHLVVEFVKTLTDQAKAVLRILILEYLKQMKKSNSNNMNEIFNNIQCEKYLVNNIKSGEIFQICDYKSFIVQNLWLIIKLICAKSQSSCNEIQTYMDSYENQTKIMIRNLKQQLNINENEENVIFAFETKQDATTGKLVTNTQVKGGHNGEKYQEFNLEGYNGLNDQENLIDNAIYKTIQITNKDNKSYVHSGVNDKNIIQLEQDIQNKKIEMYNPISESSKFYHQSNQIGQVEKSESMNEIQNLEDKLQLSMKSFNAEQNKDQSILIEDKSSKEDVSVQYRSRSGSKTEDDDNTGSVSVSKRSRSAS